MFYIYNYIEDEEQEVSTFTRTTRTSVSSGTLAGQASAVTPSQSSLVLATASGSQSCDPLTNSDPLATTIVTTSDHVSGKQMGLGIATSKIEVPVQPVIKFPHTMYGKTGSRQDATRNIHG